MPAAEDGFPCICNVKSEFAIVRGDDLSKCGDQIFFMKFSSYYHAMSTSFNCIMLSE